MHSHLRVLETGSPNLLIPCIVSKGVMTQMPASYPTDRSTCMSQKGPSDLQFCIPGGILQYHSQRNACFPYIYSISTHALVHSPDHFKSILTHVVDTSIDARICCAQFIETLAVPLGPNALMDKYGTLLLNIVIVINF